MLTSIGRQGQLGEIQFIQHISIQALHSVERISAGTFFVLEGYKSVHFSEFWRSAEVFLVVSL